MKTTGNVNIASEINAKEWNQIRTSALKAATAQLRGEVAFWVEDIVQDVLLKVSMNLDKYDIDRASICTWVNRITVNACKDYVKKKSVKNTLRLEVVGRDFDSCDDDDYHTREALYEALENTMLLLNGHDARLLTLKYYDNKSSREIAQIMDIPESHVPVFMMRARKRLFKLGNNWDMAA